tara:strand:- start:62 stop:319 length:258 start_codon:yes stop_codon:yes gene_type:complete
MKKINDVTEIDIPSLDYLLLLTQEEAKALLDSLHTYLPHEAKNSTTIQSTIIALQEIASNDQKSQIIINNEIEEDFNDKNNNCTP